MCEAAPFQSTPKLDAKQNLRSKLRSEASIENKENAARQQHMACKQLRQGQSYALQDISSEAATPASLVRSYPEDTPEAPVAKASEWIAPHVAPEAPVAKASKWIAPHVAPEAATPARLVWSHSKDTPEAPPQAIPEVPIEVRNTFVDFAPHSPDSRRSTVPLSSDSEPRDFAPVPFSCVFPATPEPLSEGWEELPCQAAQEPPERPTVISLEESLVRSAGAPSTSTSRIQLNLDLWIPSSKPLRISEHLEQEPGADMSHPGEPVRRRLIFTKSV
jgi:hypothetical protein